MITERQEEILNGIVEEYIERAVPISSQLLEKRHKLGISPATVRNEMQKLTDEGYLSQPHTSAGRVPTDKGYRFFVDELFERDTATHSPHQKALFASLRHLPLCGSSPTAYPNFAQRTFRREGSHTALSRWIEEITRFLAEESSYLALGYLADEKIIWKEGWQDIFEEPEFTEPGLAAAFARMIDDFEENIEEVFSPETPYQNKFGTGQVKIYIGRENPVSKIKDFSIITSGFDGGLLAIFGPKRMSYDKNINLLTRLFD